MKSSICIEVGIERANQRQLLQLKPARSLWLGDAPGCDLFVSPQLLGHTKAPLLLVEDGRYLVCAGPSSRISLSSKQRDPQPGTESLPMYPGWRALRLTSGAQIEVALADGTQLWLSQTEAPLPLPRAKRPPQLSSYLLGSSLLSALFLLALFLTPPEALRLELTSPIAMNQLVSVSIKPEQEEKEEPQRFTFQETQPSASTGEGRAFYEREGLAGKETPRPKKSGRYEMKANNHHPLGRQRDPSALVLSSIQGGFAQGATMGSLFAEGGALGRGLTDTLGDLSSPQIDAGDGAGGLGLFGVGIGGGGESTLLGVGKQEILGMEAIDAGIGRCALCQNQRARVTDGPDIVDGKASICGHAPGDKHIANCLGKELIRKTIQLAMPGIRFCYEQGLQQDPMLRGRIKIRFLIVSGGFVAEAEAIEGIEPSVDACVAKKISQLQFSAKEGTGAMEVSYPFVFELAGE